MFLEHNFAEVVSIQTHTFLELGPENSHSIRKHCQWNCSYFIWNSLFQCLDCSRWINLKNFCFQVLPKEKVARSGHRGEITSSTHYVHRDSCCMARSSIINSKMNMWNQKILQLFHVVHLFRNGKVYCEVLQGFPPPSTESCVRLWICLGRRKLHHSSRGYLRGLRFNLSC